MTSTDLTLGQPSKSTAGRPPRKMVERYRSSYWATCLKNESRLSWDALDAKVVAGVEDGVAVDPKDPDGKLLRVIHRIYKRGDSPVGVKLRGRTDQLDLVALAVKRAGEAGGTARTAYESPLWHLLSDPRTQTRVHVQAASSGAAGRLGLATIDPETAETFMMATGRRFPFQGDRSVIEERAHQVAELASLDALLLLGTQARLALDRFAFAELDIYIQAIRHATHCLCDLMAENFLPSGIETLIYQRLILRDWEEMDLRHWTRANLLQGDEMRSDPTRVGGERWMEWMRSNDRYHRLWLRRDEGYPIVTADSRIEWMHENVDLLRKSAMKGLLGDAAPEGSPRLALNADEAAAFERAKVLWLDPPAAAE